MPGGRPPKPVEAKRRSGARPGRDSGGRPLPELASVTALPGADGVPPVPAELNRSERAGTCPSRNLESGSKCPVCAAEPGREAWTRLWTAGATWLSPQTDYDTVLDICLGYDEEAHHRAALAEDGFYVRGQRGGLVSHPAVAQLRAVVAEIARLRASCGFTPSDRGRLGVGEVKRAETELETLLRRRASRDG